MTRRNGCQACRKDAMRDFDRAQAEWDARVAAANDWRKSKGRKPLSFWQGRPGYRFGSPDDMEVCRRVFHSKETPWWERKPGYYREEVKRALRRSNPFPKLGKRDKWGRVTYPERDYSLPLPSLSAIAKRLAGAFLHDTESEEIWDGPRAAEEYVAHRRAQLGLDLPEPAEAAA